MYISREYPSSVLMACPDPPRGIYLAYILQGLILLAAASSILAGEYFLGLAATSAFLMAAAPALMARNLRFCLPWEINVLIAASFYIHVMGHVGEYYVTLAPYYDKLAHLVASITVGFIAFFLTLLAEHRGEIRLTGSAIVLFILTSTLAAGVVWEIYEFAVDQVFGIGLQFDNTDTMLDLIFDLTGGAIVAVFAALVLARGEEDRFDRFFAGSSSGAEPTEIMDDPIDPVHSR